jgi:hypothetical protein
MGQAAGPILYGLAFSVVGATFSLAAGAVLLFMVGTAAAALLGRPAEQSQSETD